MNAGIGLRVKTGRATAVVLQGSAKAPKLVEVLALDLTDARVPASRQPYHAGLELPEGENAPMVRQACDAVHEASAQALRALLDRVRDLRLEPRGVALVVTSDSEPERMRSAHVRAHALEGRLFRDALEAAAAQCGLGCIALIERESCERAAPLLGLSPAELRRVVVGLGAGRRPWAAEEKAAALAAWVALARR